MIQAVVVDKEGTVQSLVCLIPPRFVSLKCEILAAARMFLGLFEPFPAGSILPRGHSKFNWTIEVVPMSAWIGW